MSAAPFCPDCGAELPREALAGLCPRCLLGAALAGGVAGSSDAPRGFRQPSEYRELTQ